MWLRSNSTPVGTYEKIKDKMVRSIFFRSCAPCMMTNIIVNGRVLSLEQQWTDPQM